MELDVLLMELGLMGAVILVVAGLVGMAVEGGPWSYGLAYAGPRRPVASPLAAGEPGLESLSGRLRALGGEPLSETLWSGMAEFGAGDDRVEPYLAWLRAALAPRPVGAFHTTWYRAYSPGWFDAGMFRAAAPLGWGPVRIGVVRLAFGAALVVTAYPVNGSVHVVIHGTILGGGEWERLLARGAMMYTADEEPAQAASARRAEVLHRLASQQAALRTDWVLWRISLEGRGSLVELEDGERAPIADVYVLLEMPAYTIVDEAYAERGSHHFYAAEALYWVAVAAPALGLAVNIAYPPGADPWSIYAEASRIASALGLTGVRHPGEVNRGAYSTPLLLRRAGTGVCNEQARATAMLLSNALGGASAYATLYYRDIDPAWLEHAVSLIVYPSSLAGRRGAVELPLDVDGDGVNDTADVVADTAGMEPGEIAGRLVSIHVIPPLGYTYLAGGSEASIVSQMMLNHYAGAAVAVETLPRWLKPPWLDPLSTSISGPLYMGPRSSGAQDAEEWWLSSAALSRDFRVWGVSTQGSVEKIYEELRTRSPAETRVLASPDAWEKLFEKWVEEAAGIEDLVPPSLALSLRHTLPSVPTLYSASTLPISSVFPGGKSMSADLGPC